MSPQRVRPLKLEALVEGGGQDDESLTETNIGEDYLDAMGLCVQLAGATRATSDDKVRVERSSDGSVQFTDIPSATLKLSQLLTQVLGRPGTHASVPDFSHWAGAPAEGFASGAIRQASFAGALPSVITWFASNAGTVRLYSVAMTYAGVVCTKRVHTLYQNNVAVRTLTETYGYTGALFCPSVTRTWANL